MIATHFLHCLFREFRGTSKRDPLVDDLPFPSGHPFIDNVLVLKGLKENFDLFLVFNFLYLVSRSGCTTMILEV